jgi:hypothetical protein
MTTQELLNMLREEDTVPINAVLADGTDTLQTVLEFVNKHVAQTVIQVVEHRLGRPLTHIEKTSLQKELAAQKQYTFELT